MAAVYYARGPRGLETGLGGSLNVETIELVAQNVAGGTHGRLAYVSIEQVLLWNLDVVITIYQDFAANLSSDPAWVHRVHLSPKLPFGWVDSPPTVNRLIELWWLAKILYPDLLPEDIGRARSPSRPGPRAFAFTASTTTRRCSRCFRSIVDSASNTIAAIRCPCWRFTSVPARSM